MRSYLAFAAAGISLALVSYSCVDGRRTPTTPSPAVTSLAGGVNWQCLDPVQGGPTTVNNWTFYGAQFSCPAVSSQLNVASAPVTGAPQNLRASVTGSTVRLDWSYPSGEFVTGFLLEAGSAPGVANLAVFSLPAAPPMVVVTNVPPGLYYVRIRGTGGPLGPPSNDVEVRVGGCTGLAGPPTGMTAQVNNNVVSLAWNSPGAPVTSYIIEAGSGPGLSDIVAFDTGNALTTLTATAPSGVYYVRGRTQNACGIGAPSPDLVVTVGIPPSSSISTTSSTTTTSSSSSSSSSSSTSTSTSTTTTMPSTISSSSSASSSSSSSSASSTAPSTTTTISTTTTVFYVRTPS